MRKRIQYILFCIFACTYTYAQSFCHLVQPVGTFYEDTIESAGTYYYSAWTYDLPMDVYITTFDASCSEPPQVWADLTCTPGYYSDPNIRDLVNDTALTNRYGITVPFSLGCETNYVDGHYVHHLKLGKSYRNKLQLIGVDYNVQAYVKVVLPCGGIAHMEQDTSSMACINDARWMQLEDSTHVLAFDTLSTYILPFKDWLNEADSVALYWEGTQEARVWVAGDECEFEAKASNGNVWSYYDIPANGEYHLSKKHLNDAIKGGTQDTAGIFYARVVCPEEGRLFTHSLSPDLQGATMLHYGQSQSVRVADHSFFCFPTDWKTVEWTANTRKIVTIYLHRSPDEAAIDSFKMDLQDSVRRVLIWSKPEINRFNQNATGPLLFVRFNCSKEEFKITPEAVSEDVYCDNNTIRIRPGITEKTGKSLIYGLYYADIEGYPLQIICNNNNSSDIQNLFIADTCDFALRWDMNSTAVHCVAQKLKTQRGGGTFTFDSTDIAGWAAKVTPEGYLYVRTTANGTITFITDKPEEEDPEGDDPKDDVPTGWEQTTVDTACQKILRNGQIFILRAGKTYTITGQMVKTE